jgi:hypothetical protein
MDITGAPPPQPLTATATIAAAITFNIIFFIPIYYFKLFKVYFLY